VDEQGAEEGLLAQGVSVSGWLEAGGRHPERVVGSSSPEPEGGRWNGAWLSPERLSSFVWWDAERAP
jgi:hypothetical protein